MSKRTPVEYAESVLGVHIPWQEAQDRMETHEILGSQIAGYKRSIRLVKSQLEERKMFLNTDDSLAGMKVTERREALKVLIAEDETCQALEAKLAELQSDSDIASADLKHHELGLSVLSARMYELGGLLHFYSAAKQAETIRQQVGTSVGDTQ